MKKLKSRKKKVIEAIFTVLGTAVVAVTFYVHEIRREDAKEAKDRIEHAMEQKRLRDQLSDIRNQFRSVGEFDRVAHALQNFDNLSALEVYIGTAEAQYLMIQGNLAALDSTQDLAVTLDDKDELIDRIRSREEPLRYVQRQYAEFLSAAKLFKASGRSLTSTDLKGHKAEFDELATEFHHANDGISEVLSEIIKKAEQQASSAESSYEKTTTASHFLYPFGFLLALAGKLVGIEIEDGAE